MWVRWHPGLIGLDPVFGHSLLCFKQCDLTLADHFVDNEFKIIFLFGRPLALATLWPQVFRVRWIAADIEWNQMVQLIVSDVAISVAVLLDLLVLETVGVFFIGPDFFCIAPNAHSGLDIVLSHRRIDGARGQRAVRPCIGLGKRQTLQGYKHSPANYLLINGKIVFQRIFIFSLPLNYVTKKAAKRSLLSECMENLFIARHFAFHAFDVEIDAA